MNILKEFAKIFIKSKLDDEKRKLKDKLQKQIITTTSTSVVARNTAYLRIVDKLDGKGIAEVNDNGVITGIVEGETIVTAISAEGKYRGDIKVIIKPTQGEQIEEPGDIEVDPGEDDADVSTGE